MRIKQYIGFRSICMLITTLVLSVGQLQAANIVIDSFETAFDVTGEAGWNGTFGTHLGPRSGVTILTQTGISGAIGDRTTLFTGDDALNSATILSGYTLDTSGILIASSGKGVLNVNTSAGSTAYDLQISYSVTDLDLSTGDRFKFNFSGDLDNRLPPVAIPLNIELTSGLITDTANVILSADGGPYEILFSAYSGIDFSDIDAIRLFSSDGVASPDFSLSSIEVRVVPIPAAFWLFGSALAFLGWTRKKSA